MTDFQYVAALIIGSLSVARITRAITWDDFPPSVWLRVKFADLVGDTWGKLFSCLWCFPIYPTIGVLLWGYFSEFNTVWWLFNAAFAVAYVASMIVVRDGDE